MSCGARRLKTNWQPLLGEVGGKSIPLFKDDIIVANPPGTAPGGSKPMTDKDESAAPLRKGGKAVIPAEQDEQANLPATAPEGSKSGDDLDGGEGGL